MSLSAAEISTIAPAGEESAQKDTYKEALAEAERVLGDEKYYNSLVAVIDDETKVFLAIWSPKEAAQNAKDDLQVSLFEDDIFQQPGSTIRERVIAYRTNKLLQLEAAEKVLEHGSRTPEDLQSLLDLVFEHGVMVQRELFQAKEELRAARLSPDDENADIVEFVQRHHDRTAANMLTATQGSIYATALFTQARLSQKESEEE